MSALTNPVPSPIKTPPPLEARPKPAPPRGTRPWRGAIFLVFVAVAGYLAYQFWPQPKPQTTAQVTAFRTGKVFTGPFVRTVRISGQTSARQFANVTAPRLRSYESRSNMTLLKLVKNGTWVKKGDVLAEIDPGWLIDHIDDTKATVTQAEMDVRKRLAEQAVDWENLQQNLRVAKSNADKARLDDSAAEVRTDIERELLKLAVDETVARHKQAELDIPQKKIAHGAEVKILGFTVERHKRHVDRHEVDLRRYTIISPMEGMVVISSIYRGGGESYQIQQGDQVGSGQPLMKVVNPNSMQVEASANQSESTEFRIGQRATVMVDAFTGMELKAHVYSIGALAVGGWRQNYYIRNVPIRLSIDQTDPRLIPDLSGSADVVVEEKDQALQAPVGALRTEGGKSFVYVKTPQGFARREVQVGSANNLSAIVLAGLNEGDEVRLD